MQTPFIPNPSHDAQTALPLLMSLEATHAAPLSSVGGKAANLGRLIALGLPVPPGFCLTTRCFSTALHACDADPLLAELDACPAQDQEQLRARSLELRTRLEAVPLPQALQEALEQAIATHPSSSGYAVRSSATAEDLPEASFAGQQDTFLGVQTPEALTQAIRRCWASLFTERAIHYRKQQGLPETQVRMAVVIQHMIRADAAGVLFTVDPVQGPEGGLLLEATPGLGELLVSGQVSPDRWRIDRTGLQPLEITPGHKPLKRVIDPKGGVIDAPVAPAAQNALCLSEALVQRLAQIGLQAETHFGMPQDLEWALEGDQLFFLQARAITTLRSIRTATEAPTRSPAQSSEAAAFDAVQVWSNMNAGEVLPDVVSPLTWSMIDTTLLVLFRQLLTWLGIDAGRHPIGGVVGGRVYFNLNTTLGLVRAMPFLKQVDISRILGGMPVGLEDPKIQETLLNNLAPVKLHPLVLLWRVPFFVIWYLTRTFSQAQRTLEALIARIDRATREPLAELSGPALSRAIRWPLEELGREVTTILAYPMIGMASYAALERFLHRYLPEDASPVNQLLLGQGNMASAEAGMALGRLARLAATAPSLKHVVLHAPTFAALEPQLALVPEGAAFVIAWESFMRQHGHHSRGELELANPRWDEQPDYVLAQVKGYLGAEVLPDPDALQQQNARRAQEAIQATRARLPSLWHRWRFDRLLKKTRQGVAFRENVKSHAVRLIALARNRALEAGRRLHQAGHLDLPEDVFFLELPELYQSLEAGPEAALLSELRKRKALHAQLVDITPPPVVVGPFDPLRLPHGTIAPRESGSIPQTRPAHPPDQDTFTGLAVCPGVARGPARVILRADATARVLPGEILVAPFTDPGWTPYFLPAAGIVMDMGGLLSHGSIVAREYGKPAVVNVGPATERIQTGDWLEVDGTRGVVRWGRRAR